MILYLVLIALAVLGIAVGVAVATSTSFLSVFGYTWLAALIVILIDGFTAAVCRLLPKGIANHEAKIFQVSQKEKKFYEKLKIRKWKDRVPEIGHFTGFRKNKLEDPKNVEYIDRFLLETSYGELGHFFSLFTSFLLLLFSPIYKLWVPIAIAVAIVSVLLNIPSLIILRYNSYKLRVLRKSALKKAQRESEQV